MNRLTKRLQGFTLIELMVVIGIITILAAVVIVAVNPLRQFRSARDTQRRADLREITSAIYQYSVDNNGQLPSGIPTGESNALNIGTGTGNLDLGAVLVPTYISKIPADPLNGTDADTQYTIFQTSSGRIVASASSELNPGTWITVER